MKLLGARRPFDMRAWRRERLPRLVELRLELDKRQKKRLSRGGDSDEEEEDEDDVDSEDSDAEEPFDELTEADLRDYVLQGASHDNEDEGDEDEDDEHDPRRRPGVFHVLITSFEGFLAEQDFFCRDYLRGDAWDCLIVDEVRWLLVDLVVVVPYFSHAPCDFLGFGRM